MSGLEEELVKLIQEFEAEFRNFPARFDWANITIVLDRLECPVSMSRTSGGEKHVAYHLSALLALHLFSVKNNRPILRFLLVDQPTQVYFRSADGTIQKTKAAAELIAVRRLLELLHKFTQKDVPGFQLIVTEHPNLREQWFQDALVEQPWSKPPALVPAGIKDNPLARARGIIERTSFRLNFA